MYLTGVLTLSEGADSDTGTFTGYVFGNPDNLKWAVFGDNVKGTTDGAQFTISSITDPNSNSPMVGPIKDGDVQMEHLCGMVRITINNLPEGADVKLSGTNIAGTAEWNGRTLNYIEKKHEITLIAGEGTDNTFEIPLFATDTETDVDLTLSVNGQNCSINAPVKIGSLSQKAIMTITCITDGDGKVTGLSQAATTEESLRQILQLDKDVTFQLGANITVTEKLTVANKATIDLNGFELNIPEDGIEVAGDGDANLTIQGTGRVSGIDPTQYLAEGYKTEELDDAYIVIPKNTDVATDAEDLQQDLENGATNIIIPQDMTLDASSLKNAQDLTINLEANATVTVASGAMSGNNTSIKNFTFEGDESTTVKFVNENPGYEGVLAYHDNANLTFKGITFNADDISGICARGGEVTFENCTIEGELEKTIASKFVFSGCTFDAGVTQAGYGCSDVTFENGCKFETDGYGIKIYSEGQTPVKLTVKDCSFKNTGSAAKSAIFLDHIVDGITYNITVDGCTFEGYTAIPTPNENKWAERMIVADSFVQTADGQYIFSYQTGAENGNYHKILTDEQLVVTVK